MKAITMAIFIWFGAAALAYLLFIWSPLYMAAYYLSSLFLTVVKIGEYKGTADIPKVLFEDFYGWTTLVAMLTSMPVAFFFMGDE